MGFFRGNNKNRDNNDPPGGSPSSIFNPAAPANGKGGALYSFDRGNGKSSYMQLVPDFGKGAAPAPKPMMRKG